MTSARRRARREPSDGLGAGNAGWRSGSRCDELAPAYGRERRSPSMRQLDRSAAAAARLAGARRRARRRRHVRRRRFLGCRGAAEAAPATTSSASRCSSTTTARRRAARAPAAPARTSRTRAASPRRSASRITCSTTRSRFADAVIDELRRELRRRRDADPVRHLQSADQVPRPPRHGARARRRRAGDRPLHPARATGAHGPRALSRARRATATRAISCSPRRASSCAPVVSARRHAQGRGARAGALISASPSPTSPTARTSASCRRAATPSHRAAEARRAEARRHRARRRTAPRHVTTASSTTRSASGGASRSRRPSRSMSCASMPSATRSWWDRATSCARTACP